jgi:hypothetical protein
VVRDLAYPKKVGMLPDSITLAKQLIKARHAER